MVMIQFSEEDYLEFSRLYAFIINGKDESRDAMNKFVKLHGADVCASMFKRREQEGKM